ncbi:undecaprenyldiphospho-muramoylpentapeptide beta-N-acetylglucosaminyltransferase [Aestuariivirga litoralis]|uniref:undecaprenyldiphospho-muramoylpentapeptide beta-N-acetylglucosaminyltransferase n=1 Tax=Aestuariivirga litoralis TaxID=2650924 RepID=UPI0018C59400|nr:undecaprenyldiphospho-muramoylpentapeptide beta-N-acetylglucosaminyltransferase [Aestuariivirga litoralis]MBG1231955.1 undecaprenyldiphospho-muramoylpentapeptide beta-N-acetylglucosaminyltransferase [Aestuariivirga litoralis]
MSRGIVVLAAGGTGGHLFPAQALAEVLVKRGFHVHLMTDERVRGYGKDFPAEQVHVIPSASPSFSKPWLLPMRMLRLYNGYQAAKRALTALKPVAVIGFGGYPSFPPLLAARSLKIPTAVHEQNAVMGRANGFLAARVNAIATSFKEVQGIAEAAKDKVTYTGNPVRAIAMAEAASPYTVPKEYGPFQLVVFGGSQGAKFFSEFMPQVAAGMTPDSRKRLRLVQQCRTEDVKSVQAAYDKLGLTAELHSFFSDMPKRLANAQLVVCRSGASSIAELGVIGRPAVLVPLPHAIDNDQLKNAQAFSTAGAGWVFPQWELQPLEFASFLSRLMADGAGLKKAADQALKQGVPDAAERLANLVEELSLQAA